MTFPPRINTGKQALDRIFSRHDEGKLSDQETWELANKVYDRDLVRLPVGYVGDYGEKNKLQNRITEQDIHNEDENLEFLFKEYLSDE